MLVTVAAHVSSLIAGCIAGWLIGLTIGLLNMFIATVATLVGTSVLARVGATPEHIKVFATQIANGMQWVTGAVEGIVKIVLSLLVFSYFGRQPGLVMVALFIGFQLIPIPSFLPESQRKNMRYGVLGTIFGVLIAWWIYYPKM